MAATRAHHHDAEDLSGHSLRRGLTQAERRVLHMGRALARGAPDESDRRQDREAMRASLHHVFASPRARPNTWSATAPMRMTAPITAKSSEPGISRRLTRLRST